MSNVNSNVLGEDVFAWSIAHVHVWKFLDRRDSTTRSQRDMGGSLSVMASPVASLVTSFFGSEREMFNCAAGLSLADIILCNPDQAFGETMSGDKTKNGDRSRSRDRSKCRDGSRCRHRTEYRVKRRCRCRCRDLSRRLNNFNRLNLSLSLKSRVRRCRRCYVCRSLCWHVNTASGFRFDWRYCHQLT
jgi:hypothetical protein